jgi:hypothetical protein
MSDLATIESVQKIIGLADASLEQLEAARLELDHVIAAGEAETAEIADRRTIEMNALMPAAALDKALDRLDLLDKAVARRVEIASTVRPALMARIDEARDVEAEAARQARYAAALDLHNAATGKIRAFLNRAAPEALAVMAVYREAEAAAAAVNRDLPAGSSPIRSIEAERMGALPSPKITVRKYQVFLSGRDFVAEVGKVEAHNVNGTWAIYLPSRSVQGDVVVPHCTIADFVEVTSQKYEPLSLETLATALRVPAFDAAAPKLGRGERRTMPLAEWLRMSGEPVEAEVPLPRIAAE